MRRLLKWIAGLAGLALALAIAAAGVGYVVLRNTVPSPSGTMAIPGLTAPVEVVRDREDVPHIFARTSEDAFAALGFLHAQDRLPRLVNKPPRCVSIPRRASGRNPC